MRNSQPHDCPSPDASCAAAGRAVTETNAQEMMRARSKIALRWKERDVLSRRRRVAQDAFSARRARLPVRSLAEPDRERRAETFAAFDGDRCTVHFEIALGQSQSEA